jgi:hypothetical protein
VTPQNMAIFYWNGFTQEYELISSSVNLYMQMITGYTDHFSRYVIATTSY